MYVKIKDPIMYSYHVNVRYIYSSSKKESINKDNKYWRQSQGKDITNLLTYACANIACDTNIKYLLNIVCVDKM